MEWGIKGKMREGREREKTERYKRERTAECKEIREGEGKVEKGDKLRRNTYTLLSVEKAICL